MGKPSSGTQIGARARSENPKAFKETRQPEKRESSLSFSGASSPSGAPHHTPVGHPPKTVPQQDHRGLRTSNLIIMQMIHQKAVKGPGSPGQACAAAPPAVPLRAEGEAPPRTATREAARPATSASGPLRPPRSPRAPPRRLCWDEGLEHGPGLGLGLEHRPSRGRRARPSGKASSQDPPG